MKILFIYTDVSSSVGVSAGIGILSAVLKREGHDTEMIHVSEEIGYPLDLQRITDDIRKGQPDLICFSITTNQWYFARQIGRHLKERFRIPIIVGGHHPTADPERVVLEPWIDVVCRGEGEQALLSVVQRLASGESFHGIPNILFRDHGEIVQEPLLSWEQNLDDLPFEDHRLFNYGKIVATRGGWAEVIVTRGCPYPCTYCFNQPLFEQYRADSQTVRREAIRKKAMIRRRSVDGTIRLLKELKQTYPQIKGFTFVDDIMAQEGEWFDQFAHRYPREIGLPYACTSQPLMFTGRIAEQLRDSGCKVVKMGVEAGNERIRRKVLKRNISNEHLIEVFQTAKAYGLKPQSFNMIGIPGETIENMMETIRLNAVLKPYIVWLSTFNPYPGTELYRECVAKGMIDESKWEEVDSYRGGSVLKDEYLPSLELKKIRVLFRWMLNANLGNGAAAVYRKEIDAFLALPATYWANGAIERMFAERDAEVDMALRQRDVSHYVSKKYINMLWGKEYGYDLT